MVNLSAYESRVLWYLFRKTYGWNKKTDWIALSQFSKDIGLDRRLVHRAIHSLSSKQMIVIYKDDRGRVCYGFQKNYEKWEVSSKKMTVIDSDDEVSSIQMTRLSSIQIPTKESITKETNTKEKDISTGVSPVLCPHAEIIKLYHKTLPQLPRVIEWTETRQGFLRTRWKEKPERQNLAWWDDYFKGVAESDYLTGKVNGFKADLEWLVRPSNFVKVIEGRYKNNDRQEKYL
jgi:phage replication O-like protein O